MTGHRPWNYAGSLNLVALRQGVVAEPVLPASEPNTRLNALIMASGASRKSLALRINELAATDGKHTAYTHTSLANWTRRGIMPEREIRPLIALALAERLGQPVTLAEIGMQVDDRDPAPAGLDFPRTLPKAILAATDYWSLVDRQDFLAAASLTMTGWTTPVRRWLTTPADPYAAHVGSLRRVGAADVTELLTAAEDARRWDSRYGGGSWRSSAILDCLRERATPLLHGRYNDRTGRQLFAATAQLSRLAGWTAFDSGQHAAAQRHYIQALRLARAASDVPFGGYVLVCAALQASLRGFHDDAIDMCQGAYERAKHTATLLDQAANRHGEDPPWIDFYTHTRLTLEQRSRHAHRHLRPVLRTTARRPRRHPPPRTTPRPGSRSDPRQPSHRRPKLVV